MTEVQNAGSKPFPKLWVGTATGSGWGVATKHHPEQHLHAEPDLQWHDVTDFPLTFKVLQQSGRNLEVLVITGNHESRGILTLLADGSGAVGADETSTVIYTINGNKMTGLRTAHHEHPESESVRFEATVIELEAQP